MKPHLNPHHKPVKRSPKMATDRLTSDMMMMPLARVLSGKENIDLMPEDIKKAMHDKRFRAAARGVRHAIGRELHVLHHRPDIVAAIEALPRDARLAMEQVIASCCAAVMVTYFKRQRERES